jgi:hypothetical protein
LVTLGDAGLERVADLAEAREQAPRGADGSEERAMQEIILVE